jgi:hypothetical protein
MNHTEAVEQLAIERYLLDEFAPGDREAFEEHLFDCQECALDLRASTLFVDEAKTQLPSMLDSSAAERKAPRTKPGFWLFLLRPALVGPAFAALLAVVVFQNAVTFPALRDAASQPRLMPLTHLRPATRGASHLKLIADRAHGAALQVDLPDQGSPAPTSYSIELLDAQGKSIWTATMPANPGASDQNQQLSLFIPGARLGDGTYTLNVTGRSASGEPGSAEEYIFDIVVSN